MSAAPAVAPGSSWLGAVARARDLGIAGFVVALVVVFGTLEPLFLRPENLGSIVLSISILAILAVGEMLVIITRNIDLSVGSVVGLSAMTMAITGRDHPDAALAILLAVALITGLVAGLANGLLVVAGGVPPIIATLGTLAIFRGLTFLVSGNRQVDPQDIPKSVTDLAVTSPIGIAWLVLIAIGVAIGGWFLTKHTLTGRRLFAIGSSPEAASSRGLNIKVLTLGVFCAMGVLGGLGGAMYAARYATVNPADAGLGLELTVISAVVIGGTNIFGGSGSVVGTILGCVLVGVLANGLTVVGVSGFWQSAATGAIILAAVIVDSSVRRGLDRRQAVLRRGGAA